MAMRTILVPLFGNGGDGRSLAAAADIARRMEAHVTALYCESDPTDFLQPVPGSESGAAFPDALLKTLQDRAEARRRAAEHTFAEWLPQSSAAFAFSPGETRAATAELIVASGPPVSVIRDYAVVADLVVVAIPERGDPERGGVLEVTLFDTGRPILAVPAAPPPTIFTAPVAIAWNYSAEAARALNAALPIIERVGEAVVLQAGHHEDDAAARRVASYLGWHGVKASALKLGQASKPADLVAAKVRELGAGLLVMGAYSHTRAREFVFGGMTSYMLEKAPVPLLLAH
jgi:nucleotide-binding universal stress UspA family protein